MITDTPVVSEMPMTNASTVVAARCGLRTALPTASRPGTPNRRSTGNPTTRASGPTRTGPKTTTPRKNSTPPAPTSTSGYCRPSLASAAATHNSPSTQSATAQRMRLAPTAGVIRSATTRKAATGGTRVAARAGTAAAPTVAAAPVSTAIRIVAGVTVKTDTGRSAPATRITGNAANATATPTAAPKTDATTPTTPASARIDPNTWPREAPIQRASASSRVRLLSKMVNVLWMTNTATSSATSANISRPVLSTAGSKPLPADSSSTEGHGRP